MAAKLHHTQVIRRPLLSEKSTFGMNELKRYAFLVDAGASKVEIKDAIEAVYSVKVASVNTQVRKGKARRLKYGVVVEPQTKKAIVKLVGEDKIELF
jgi:large subunit ribosomal protein L23